MVMWYLAAADIVLLVHFGFILFVMFGGLLVFRSARWSFFHLPAALWGVVIELKGWVCPLTPLENRLRLLAGELPYSGDFIGHYLLPVVYPRGLTPSVQLALAIAVCAANALIYALFLRNVYLRWVNDEHA